MPKNLRKFGHADFGGSAKIEQSEKFVKCSLMHFTT